MNYELINTSAPRGLVPGSRGFTTVAHTVDMPPALVQACEVLSNYTHVFGVESASYRMNPIAWSCCNIALAGEQYHILSRVGVADADYSGRSNKIAHHLVIDSGTAALYPAGPAWLLLNHAFRREWQGEPRLLQPPALPAPSLSQPQSAQEFRAKNWQGAGLKSESAGRMAGAWLADHTRPTFFLFGGEQTNEKQLLLLIEDAVKLMPPQQRWQFGFSTYLSSDFPAGSQCLCRGVVKGSSVATIIGRVPDAMVVDLETSSVAGGNYASQDPFKLCSSASGVSLPGWHRSLGSRPQPGDSQSVGVDETRPRVSINVLREAKRDRGRVPRTGRYSASKKDSNSSLRAGLIVLSGLLAVALGLAVYLTLTDSDTSPNPEPPPVIRVFPDNDQDGEVVKQEEVALESPAAESERQQAGKTEETIEVVTDTPEPETKTAPEEDSKPISPSEPVVKVHLVTQNNVANKFEKLEQLLGGITKIEVVNYESDIKELTSTESRNIKTKSQGKITTWGLDKNLSALINEKKGWQVNYTFIAENTNVTCVVLDGIHPFILKEGSFGELGEVEFKLPEEFKPLAHIITNHVVKIGVTNETWKATVSVSDNAKFVVKVGDDDSKKSAIDFWPLTDKEKKITASFKDKIKENLTKPYELWTNMVDLVCAAREQEKGLGVTQELKREVGELDKKINRLHSSIAAAITNCTEIIESQNRQLKRIDEEIATLERDKNKKAAAKKKEDEKKIDNLREQKNIHENIRNAEKLYNAKLIKAFPTLNLDSGQRIKIIGEAIKEWHGASSQSQIEGVLKEWSEREPAQEFFLYVSEEPKSGKPVKLLKIEMK